ncbi:hypothetical protein G6F40_016096 [Rhizopus arrhizus]|nr:hypothetical protein G6F40_016096 [Rhizopus arrhizus]
MRVPPLPVGGPDVLHVPAIVRTDHPSSVRAVGAGHATGGARRRDGAAVVDAHQAADGAAGGGRDLPGTVGLGNTAVVEADQAADVAGGAAGDGSRTADDGK